MMIQSCPGRQIWEGMRLQLFPFFLKWPILKGKKWGVAVAAETEAIAEEALSRIRVEWTKTTLHPGYRKS